MSYKVRYLTQQVIKDLQKKMVFVGGPRQVGKTTLAKHLIADNLHGYLNWDNPAHKEAIINLKLPDAPLWVFDEIHKYRHWRNYIKGLYDTTHRSEHKILVTGSARLDYYRRGGDSLQGRYHYLRLGPLSVSELGLTTTTALEDLFILGGFPEPFFGGSHVEAKRWSREYRHRLIQEDLLSLESVRDINSLELLMLRLPECVGSPLSVNALREDLQVSHKTMTHWLDILTRLYVIFCLPAFGSPLIKAVKKAQKHYQYDWTLVQIKDDIGKGQRFENLMAVHLLKWVNFVQDTQGREVELRYFRDSEGREVDFIIVEDGQPIVAIECKWSDASISPSLVYFKKKFPACQAWQLSMVGKKDYVSAKHGIRVCSALRYLANRQVEEVAL